MKNFKSINIWNFYFYNLQQYIDNGNNKATLDGNVGYMPRPTYKTISCSKYFYSHFCSRGNGSTNIKNVSGCMIQGLIYFKIILVNN